MASLIYWTCWRSRRTSAHARETHNDAGRQSVPDEQRLDRNRYSLSVVGAMCSFSPPQSLSDAQVQCADCPADLNGDWMVGAADVLLLLADRGT